MSGDEYPENNVYHVINTIVLLVDACLNFRNICP